MMVSVTGLKEAVKSFSKVHPEVVAAIKAVNLAAAKRVASLAEQKAPRVSGKLAGNIRAGATKFAASVRVGGASVPYAAPIHWGWPSRNIAPKKFLYEALDEVRPQVVLEYNAGVSLALDKAFAGAHE